MNLGEPDNAELKTLVRQVPGTGDGTVGTAGADGPAPTMVIAWPWWKMLGVRVIRSYLEALTGLMALDGVGALEFAGHSGFFIHLWAGMGLALGPAAVSLLLNLTEFVRGLDVSNPKLRG